MLQWLFINHHNEMKPLSIYCVPSIGYIYVPFTFYVNCRLIAREDGSQKVCIAGLTETPVTNVDMLINVCMFCGYHIRHSDIECLTSFNSFQSPSSGATCWL